MVFTFRPDSRATSRKVTPRSAGATEARWGPARMGRAIPITSCKVRTREDRLSDFRKERREENKRPDTFRGTTRVNGCLHLYSGSPAALQGSLEPRGRKFPVAKRDAYSFMNTRRKGSYRPVSVASVRASSPLITCDLYKSFSGPF